MTSLTPTSFNNRAGYRIIVQADGSLVAKSTLSILYCCSSTTGANKQSDLDYSSVVSSLVMNNDDHVLVCSAGSKRFSLRAFLESTHAFWCTVFFVTT